MGIMLQAVAFNLIYVLSVVYFNKAYHNLYLNEGQLSHLSLLQLVLETTQAQILGVQKIKFILRSLLGKRNVIPLSCDKKEKKKAQLIKYY